ncbi:unnamed protein product [Blepharisma stoltei]|uniref:Uncharacterized protein n=1 Tax=Blepharisma stoltei TaxID=1481888 RepID=A0AAU9JGZ5_9CILI|nr:unnamed protein product [Blepharisma stoltei]
MLLKSLIQTFLLLKLVICLTLRWHLTTWLMKTLLKRACLWWESLKDQDMEELFRQLPALLGIMTTQVLAPLVGQCALIVTTTEAVWAAKTTIQWKSAQIKRTASVKMLLIQKEPALVHKLNLGLMDRLAKLVNQAVIMEGLDALLAQHQGL